MTRKPFCLITIRDHDDAAAAERESVRQFGGLSADEIVQVRAEPGLQNVRLDDYAGLIVGGSPYNASDPVKSELQLRIEAELSALVDEAVERDYPLLGICYGVGLLTQRLGGLVTKRYNERPGVTEVRITAAGREDPVFADLPASFIAYTGHKEACAMLPDKAVSLAAGRRCPVQAYRVGDNCYLVQFHVELDAAALEKRMRLYANHGYFRPEELEMLVEENNSAGVGPAPRQVLANFCTLIRSRETQAA
ncbi:glutamine amidotransferase [Nigerium massiliense]|uniref:glutamine amidotransferase n=1 Tax=Nigerium massiliense TaxID=1522317 RepID=UPI00058CFB5A|nr:glutamine amidotransferase [Nigerium massiliense]